MAKKKDDGTGAPQHAGEATVVTEGDRGQRSETVAELATDGGRLDAATAAGLAAMAPPHGEPGPEDFERHAGARLLEDQGSDLRLQAEIERRLRKRGDVIAKRLRASGGVNATVEINGVAYVARQRPRCPGEMMLSEAVTHTRATLA